MSNERAGFEQKRAKVFVVTTRHTLLCCQTTVANQKCENHFGSFLIVLNHFDGERAETNRENSSPFGRSMATFSTVFGHHSPLPFML
jgi:hypothetical protein